MEMSDIRTTRAAILNVFKKRNVSGSTIDKIVNNFISSLKESNSSAAITTSFQSKNVYLRTLYFREEDSNQLNVESPGAWNVNYTSSRLSTCMGGGRPDPWIEFGEEIGRDWPKCFHIAYCRTFEGWNGPRKDYWEPDQDFIHFSGAHWRAEHKGHCRFNSEGDLHFSFFGNTDPEHPNMLSEAYVSEADIRKYFLIAKYKLVQFFEISVLPEKKYGLDNRPKEEILSGGNYSISLRRGPENNFEARGYLLHDFELGEGGRKQVLDEHWRFDEEDLSDISLIVHDFRRHGFKTASKATSVTVTLAEGELINYFQAETSEAPFELSPAFFKSEVLSRYLADPDRFEVDDSSISCRNAWHLKFFGVNSAGQVFAYPCDLKRLPKKEVQYWSLYNVVPKATISKNAFQSHFLGEWQTEPEPVRDIKHWLRDNTPTTFLSKPTEKELSAIKPIFFESRKEWGDTISALSKAIVEKLNFKALKKLSTKMGIADDTDGKSVKLAEAILSSGGNPHRLTELRNLIELRNKTSAHSAEKACDKLLSQAKIDHGSLREHIEHITEQLKEELDFLTRKLQQLNSA